MKVKVVVHEVPPDEGSGFWAEVPALPGCVTQAETWYDLMQNLHEAIEGWLLIDQEPVHASEHDHVLEIAV
jgi:predicted RNase H-like HicB family nuclease